MILHDIGATTIPFFSLARREAAGEGEEIDVFSGSLSAQSLALPSKLGRGLNYSPNNTLRLGNCAEVALSN